MKQRSKRRVRWLRRGALGLAALAVAVPASPALGAIPSEPAQLVPVRDLPSGVTEPLRRPPFERPPAVVTVTRAPAGNPGFDWSDAGVGIAIGVAASLAAGTAFLATRGVRRRPDHLARA